MFPRSEIEIESGPADVRETPSAKGNSHLDFPNIEIASRLPNRSSLTRD